MDDEMIDRVSKAILECPNASDYRTLVAKRAIEAMREPTQKMMYEGVMVMPDYDPGIDNARDVWQAMINTIIGD